MDTANPQSASSSTDLEDRLDLAVPSIRLAQILPPNDDGTIHFSTRHELVESAPAYTALSFMWGFLEPAATAQQGHHVYINGRPHPVTNNLWNFLNVAQYQFALTDFWIDTICINQSDLKERNHQVAQMSRIYAQASLVLLWLGKGNVATRSFACAVNEGRWSNNSAMEHLLDMRSFNDSPDELVAIGACQIFNNLYWERYWIIQELLLAREIKVMTGELTFDWGPFVQQYRLQRFAIPGALHGRAQNIINARTLRRRNRRRVGVLQVDTDSIAELIHLFQGGLCQERVDKIFSLQGIARKEDRVPVDYSEPFEMVAVHTLLRTLNTENPLFSGEVLKALDLDLFGLLRFLDSRDLSGILDHQLLVDDAYRDLETNQDGSHAATAFDTRYRDRLRKLRYCACRQCEADHHEIQARDGDIAAFIPRTDLLVLMRPHFETAMFTFVACIESSCYHEHSPVKNVCFMANRDLRQGLADLNPQMSSGKKGFLDWKLSLRQVLIIHHHMQMHRVPRAPADAASEVVLNRWSHAGLYTFWKGHCGAADIRSMSDDRYMDDDEWESALTHQAKVERTWYQRNQAGGFKDPEFCKGHPLAAETTSNALIRASFMRQIPRTFCEDFKCVRRRDEIEADYARVAGTRIWHDY